MADQIAPGQRAHWDRVLAGGITAMLSKAAEYDGMEIIDANVAFMNDLLELPLGEVHMAAAAAGLALRLHRSGDPRG